MTAIKYVFAERPLTIRAAKKASAQRIGEALAAVADKGGGRLTPKEVVKAARDQRNALHKHFTWDDAVAAAAFRLEQARMIIRCIRVEDSETEDGTARAFLSIQAGRGMAYYTLDSVKASRELQLLVLRQAERDLAAFERRYHELDDICSLVRTAHGRLTELIGNVETRVQV